MNFIKTLINALKTWAENKFLTHENISVATDQDIIELMLDMDMMPVVQDADGTILVDSDNTIILT